MPARRMVKLVREARDSKSFLVPGIRAFSPRRPGEPGLHPSNPAALINKK